MRQVCQAMMNVGSEARLWCGCTLPVLAEACSVDEHVKAKMPVVDGKLCGQKAVVLRDTGCSTIVVRRSFVDNSQLTGRTVMCVMIDGTAKRYPTALVEVQTPYFTGTTEVVCMENPLYDLIIGNVSGVHEGTDVEVQICYTGEDQKITAENFEETGYENSSNEIECEYIQDCEHEECNTETEVKETQAVVTRAQAQKEHKVTLLKVSENIDCNLTTEELAKLQKEDETLRKWWDATTQKPEEVRDEHQVRFQVKNGLLWRRREEQGRTVNQLAVPKPLREKVMKLSHDDIMSGHQGVKKTYDRIIAHFFWPGIHGDVVRYCQSCDICQRTVAKGRVPKTPLGKMPLIDSPFKRVAVDLVGPIAPVTDRGNRYILVMVDYATRYPEATALKSIEAETVAEALVTMFTRVGIAEEILSDQGSQFMSGVMKEVSRLLSMSQLVATPYHPMCNGLVERFNGTLKQMLKRMCTERPKDWDRYLPALLFAYREVPQESLGFSPFELLYGRTVRGPMSILKEIWTKQLDEPEVKTTYQYVLELQDRLQETCEVAKRELSKVQGKQKKHFDVKSKERKFKTGDKVLLLLPTDGNKLLMQ